MAYRLKKILGVNFIDGAIDDVIEYCCRHQLIVAPAAPALARIREPTLYRESLLNADIAIIDSGFLVILWFLRTFEVLQRCSGVRYLKSLLPTLYKDAQATVFWIMPTQEIMNFNCEWLNRNGYKVSFSDCYVAPIYNATNVIDSKLLAEIEQRRPRHIIITVGGGIQEPLGLFLKRNLMYQPTIHCIGAALSLISGKERKIPDWADRLFLGWLIRLINSPLGFGPRLKTVLRLAPLVFRYGQHPPTKINNTYQQT